MRTWSSNLWLLPLVLLTSALIGKYGFDWQQAQLATVMAQATPSRPSRIVSTEYNINEILMDLVAPERIAALSQDADNPGLCNILERTAQVAGRVASSPLRVEQILALGPDLVLVGSRCPAEVKALLELGGARVIAINRGYTIAEIQENILTIGQAVGEPARAQALVDDMNRQLAAIRAAVAGAPLLRALYIGSGYGYTAGIGTYTDELLQIAGARNAAREAGVQAWGKISLETVIEMNPDVIFVPDTGGKPHGAVGIRSVVPFKSLENDPCWQDVRAVREGRVVALPPRFLLCNSHYNVQAGWALARALHPDRFQE